MLTAGGMADDRRMLRQHPLRVEGNPEAHAAERQRVQREGDL
jgi:hypothetical protein